MGVPHTAKEMSALSVSDNRLWRKHFTDQGWPLPQLYFRFKASDDRWEVWRINASSTLIATRLVDADWVTL